MKAQHIAGATVAIASHGTIVYQKPFGYADLAGRVRASNDTVYPIGSITKQFTAACMLLLARDGKLSIDDPLSRYVPDLPWATRVTLRQMLDQESGIVDFRLGSADYTGGVTQARIIDRLKQTDLLFTPGSKYEYSNSNYYLLGMVIEKVSGEAYQAFLEQRVVAPLGLKSVYYNGGSAIPKLAKGTNATPNGPQPVPPENADWAFAAGALASSAADLTRWDDALRAGKLLPDASLADMFTPGTLIGNRPTDYAFGWVVVNHNRAVEIWHNGEVTGFHAMNVMYPDTQTDVVVLTNTGGTFAADELAVRIFDILYPFKALPIDADMTQRAREWLNRIEHGDVDRAQLTTDLNAALSDSVVKGAGGQLRTYGALKTVALTAIDEDSSGRNYGFTVTFARQAVRWLMGVNRAGKISALYFKPL